MYVIDNMHFICVYIGIKLHKGMFWYKLRDEATLFQLIVKSVLSIPNAIAIITQHYLMFALNSSPNLHMLQRRIQNLGKHQDGAFLRKNGAFHRKLQLKYLTEF